MHSPCYPSLGVEGVLINVREIAFFLIFTCVSAVPTTKWSYSCAKKKKKVCLSVAIMPCKPSRSLKPGSWAAACSLENTLSLPYVERTRGGNCTEFSNWGQGPSLLMVSQRLKDVPLPNHTMPELFELVQHQVCCSS